MTVIHDLTVLELGAERLSFSAGHFTIYSATHRECLHGHNYRVEVAITTEVNQAGICFDYAIYNETISNLCRELNITTLIPTQSPYLTIQEEGDYYHIIFNNEKMIFLKKDVKLLPIRNTTLEELAKWFVSRLIEDEQAIINYHIYALEVKVFNGPAQCANARWER